MGSPFIPIVKNLQPKVLETGTKVYPKVLGREFVVSNFMPIIEPFIKGIETPLHIVPRVEDGKLLIAVWTVVPAGYKAHSGCALVLIHEGAVLSRKDVEDVGD